MGFRQADSEGRGGYARLWSVEDKGSYSLAKLSTSKKRRDTDTYETDFQDGFVRLIGSAHTKAQSISIPEKGISIQIKSCEVTTSYDAKAEKSYVNYAIFAFDTPDGNDTSKKSTAKTSRTRTKVETSEEEDSDLPF